MPRKRDWSPEELEEVKSLWGVMVVSKMARHFRTNTRVLDRLAYQLGLPARVVQRKPNRSYQGPPTPKRETTLKPCHKCERPFKSEGKFNILCGDCKRSYGAMTDDPYPVHMR